MKKDEARQINVKQIVKDYLNQNGYGGLCTSGCGCETNDLAPCLNDGIPAECVPGYRHEHSNHRLIIISTDKAPKTDAEIQKIIDEADL